MWFCAARTGHFSVFRCLFLSNEPFQQDFKPLPGTQDIAKIPLKSFLGRQKRHKIQFSSFLPRNRVPKIFRRCLLFHAGTRRFFRQRSGFQAVGEPGKIGVLYFFEKNPLKSLTLKLKSTLYLLKHQNRTIY